MRVFCTVGSQLPFDRLIQTVADYADSHSKIECFYQVGQNSSAKLNAEHCESLEAEEYAQRIEWSDLMISHAGMGTILTALTNSKPILVMPRSAALGEHRNDHQLHTATRLKKAGLIHVASQEQELAGCLENLSQLTALRTLGPLASSKLIDRVQSFLNESD